MNIGSFLQTGGSFVEGLINRDWAAEQNRNDRDFAREQASTAYQRQNELYDKMFRNDIAAPALTAQILAQSGINPNLAAGGNIGSVPSAPSVAPGAQPSSHLAQFGLGLGDFAARANELERIRTQNLNESKLTDAQCKELLAQANLTDVKVDEVKAQIENIWSSVALNKANTVHVGTLNESDQLHLQNALIDMIKRRTFIDDEFDQVARDYGINELEYKYLVATQSARILGVELSNKKLATDIGLNQRQIEDMDKFLKYADKLYRSESMDAAASALISGYDADLKSTYGDFEKILGLVNSASSSAGDLTRIISRRYRRGKPGKRR